MESLIAGFALAFGPFATVAAVLWIATRAQAARERRVAQQIALTEAIHRTLGAVVAPTVLKPLLGAPEVLIPVPRSRPDLVGRVVSVVDEALTRMAATEDGPAPTRIVLTSQESPRAA
jgi:hypothetical protein